MAIYRSMKEIRDYHAGIYVLSLKEYLVFLLYKTVFLKKQSYLICFVFFFNLAFIPLVSPDRICSF